MKNNSILIISNSYEKGQYISEKLKLLRNCDTIKIVSYIESISVLNTTQPNIIILYCAQNDSLGVIKEIRQISSLDKVPILFTADTFDEEKLLYAFDNGIDDFFFLDNSDSVILMRMLLTLQKSVLYKQIDMNNKILIAANILDKQSGIYLKDMAAIALKNFFTQSIEENLENTVLMYIRPVNNGDKRLNTYKIANTVKKTLRGNDIIAHGKSLGFYIILYNAGKSGAKSVFERICTELKNDCKMYACAAEITTAFEEMEPVLYTAVKEQIKTDTDFNYLYNTNFKETAKVVDIKDETGKRLKDFKKEFLQNFEKITAPVFYRIQTAYTDKIENAEINYSLNENESKFSVTGNENSSELVITYPTYMKVIVDIRHFIANHPPTVKRLTYDFEDFSEEKISILLEDMIKDYLNNSILDKLYTSE